MSKIIRTYEKTVEFDKNTKFMFSLTSNTAILDVIIEGDEVRMILTGERGGHLYGSAVVISDSTTTKEMWDEHSHLILTGAKFISEKTID